MYIPDHYLTTNHTEIINLMKRYNFGIMVTVKDNFQSATHLPFVICETKENITLLSHMAKGNKQWEEIMENHILVIFNGPHAYISPTHYESTLNVPTWNYITVHAYGDGKIISEPNQSLEIMEKMITTHERDYLEQWGNLPINYKEKMLNAIVTFEITVTKLEAKKKLSQNKSENEIKHIIKTFEESANSQENELAIFMKKANNIN